jgi:type I restriction-modification system DNA methylase subunit
MVMDKIKALINKYDSLKSKGLIKTYDEANTCKDFILPLFEALGWDISNREEVTAQASASRGRVDYAFCIKGIPKFFLEAKSLKTDLNEPRWAEQTINYAWHKGVVWAVLTDFEAIKVFNAEWISKNPNESLFFEIRYDKYLENFDQLSLLSKQAFLENRLDKEAEKWGKKRRKIPVDEKLLSDILKWRNLLANSLRKNHPALLEEELDESIQRILDRLIFIRTCEDRNIEPVTLSPLLREWLDSGKKRRLSQGLKSVFRNFDDGYNSQIFSPHLCEDLKINEEVLEIIINGLYETEDRSIRYDFSAIDADVLGSMYEQYLGHILKKTPTRATVKEKHLRRKEMGIYYTPKYIVDYIVKNTVSEILKEKSYKDAMKLKILDPACGSGSFLIRAFEEMDNYLKEKRSQKGEEFAYFRRMEILNDNLYGVDLDKQAVEIAQLNLLLKVLESRQKLPIIKNIRRGNSLISGDELMMFKYFGKDWKEKHPFNWQEEYSEVFKDGGFDVIIGNPPWVDIKGLDLSLVNYCFSHYLTTSNRMNIFVVFIERSLQLLRDGGYFGCIVPNSILSQSSYEKLRHKILQDFTITCIARMPDNVFMNVKAETAILILRKTKRREQFKNEIVIFDRDSDLTFFDYEKALEVKSIDQNLWNNEKYYTFNIFTTRTEMSILKKIESAGISFSYFCDFTLGITPYDKYKGHTQKQITERVFHTIKKIDKTCKPLLAGGDIRRYSLRWNGKEWLKYGPWLGAPRKERFFTQPRILVRQIVSGTPLRIFATVTSDEYCNTQTIFNIIPKQTTKESLQYLLAVLNSKVMNFYHAQRYLDKSKILFQKVLIQNAKQFPIRKINFSNFKDKKMHDDLVKLVDMMLDLNKQIQKVPEKSDKWYNLKYEIEKTDEKIDEMVYQLYGIMEKERKIIEKITLTNIEI